MSLALLVRLPEALLLWLLGSPLTLCQDAEEYLSRCGIWKVSLDLSLDPIIGQVAKLLLEVS